MPSGDAPPRPTGGDTHTTWPTLSTGEPRTGGSGGGGGAPGSGGAGWSGAVGAEGKFLGSHVRFHTWLMTHRPLGPTRSTGFTAYAWYGSSAAALAGRTGVSYSFTPCDGVDSSPVTCPSRGPVPHDWNSTHPSYQGAGQCHRNVIGQCWTFFTGSVCAGRALFLYFAVLVADSRGRPSDSENARINVSRKIPSQSPYQYFHSP